MIIRLIGTLALLASFGLGALANQFLETQASPPAYFVTLFGGQSPMQIVVVAFDSMEKLQAWHQSDAFNTLYDIHKISSVRAFAVKGVASEAASVNSSISQQ